MVLLRLYHASITLWFVIFLIMFFLNIYIRLQRQFCFGFWIVAFLLNLYNDLMKELVQVSDKYRQRDILVINELLFYAIILLWLIFVLWVFKYWSWGLCCILKVVKVVWCGSIELFLYFWIDIFNFRHFPCVGGETYIHIFVLVTEVICSL